MSRSKEGHERELGELLLAEYEGLSGIPLFNHDSPYQDPPDRLFVRRIQSVGGEIHQRVGVEMTELMTRSERASAGLHALS